MSKYRRMDEYITPKANWAPFPSKNIRKVAIRTIQDHPLSTSLHHFDGLFCFLKLSKSSSMRGSPSNRSIGNSSFSPGAMLPDRSLCAGPISRFTIHATTDCFSFKCDYKAVLLTADLQSHYFASSLFNTRLVLQVSNRRWLLKTAFNVYTFGRISIFLKNLFAQSLLETTAYCLETNFFHVFFNNKCTIKKSMWI